MNNFPTSSVSVNTRAIVSRSGRLAIEDISHSPLANNELSIDVMAIGICRTDLYAISGEIPTKPDPLIPGHEFSGVVAEVGVDVVRFQVGDRVVINPVVGCGLCFDCQHEQSHLCSRTSFMGVDFDGACREQVRVAETMVHKLPVEIPFDVAAFAEPVAATLGVFTAGIRSHEKGLVLGEGRITKLAERVLCAKNFTNVTVSDLEQARRLPDGDYDFVIETNATTPVFSEMVRLVRSRGRLVLKSRQCVPFEVTLHNVVPKQPIIEVVNYGPFSEAMELLVKNHVVVDDLIGQRFLLGEFDKAFEVASQKEDKKTFLTPRSFW